MSIRKLFVLPPRSEPPLNLCVDHTPLAMPVHRAEVGDRFGDGSGWERLVSVDRSTDTMRIELNGSVLVASAAELDWLMRALGTVRQTTRGAATP